MSEAVRVMIYRRTVSIVDWHDDGSCCSAIWEADQAEREQVESLFRDRPVARGIVTAEQSAEAYRATRGWLTVREGEDSRTDLAT